MIVVGYTPRESCPYSHEFPANDDDPAYGRIYDNMPGYARPVPSDLDQVTYQSLLQQTGDRIMFVLLVLQYRETCHFRSLQ